MNASISDFRLCNPNRARRVHGVTFFFSFHVWVCAKALWLVNTRLELLSDLESGAKISILCDRMEARLYKEPCLYKTGLINMLTAKVVFLIGAGAVSRSTEGR